MTAAVAQSLMPSLMSSSTFSEGYDCDETGYFYQVALSKMLATFERRGFPRSKERITAILSCIASGSNKMPIWIIGRSEKPQCIGL